MESSTKPMSADQFRAYESELVGDAPRAHARLAVLMHASEVGVKRYATEGRTIPDYIAQSLRSLVLLKRKNYLKDLEEMP